MPKKGGKKKNKGGAKPAAAAAAAVDKVADTVKDVVKPDNEVEEGAASNGVKSEVAAKTEVPAAEAQTSETTAPAVTETKEAEKAVEEPAQPVQKPVEKVEEPLKPEPKVEAPVTESTVQDIVEKTQAAKAGQLPELETESEGKAVLPATTPTISTAAADLYPSTTETAAEESATSTAAATGVVAPVTSLPERPKAADESTPAAAEPTVAPIKATPAAVEPVVPLETDAAHAKRPYEKPIFSSDEVKPHKMPKTEEEQVPASVGADQTVLAGAGPASTAAYTVPEPVPEPKTAEEKKDEQKAEVPKIEEPVTTAEPPKAATVVPAPAAAPSQTKESKASPDAVAAAAAAINSSRADKTATTGPIPVASTEPKKPEPVVKRGEEPRAKVDVPTEMPKETTAPQTAEPEPAKKGEEPQAEQPSAEQQAEKKKGGFFAKLKRMFK